MQNNLLVLKRELQEVPHSTELVKFWRVGSSSNDENNTVMNKSLTHLCDNRFFHTFAEKSADLFRRCKYAKAHFYEYKELLPPAKSQENEILLLTMKEGEFESKAWEKSDLQWVLDFQVQSEM